MKSKNCINRGNSQKNGLDFSFFCPRIEKINFISTDTLHTMKKIFLLAGTLSLASLGVYVLSPVLASAPTMSAYPQKAKSPTADLPLSFSGDQVSPTLLAARISGLVCDLCVDRIEKELNAVPSIVSVKAFPREGVVFMGIQGIPDIKMVSSTLLKEGYNVHDLFLTKGNLDDAAKNPTEYAKNIWTAGAVEQKKLMSDPKNLQPTCEKKKEFASAYSNPFG